MSNRYTQIQPSAYNPMSLQEIMMAPTLQRAQHDQTNAKIQEYLTSLNSIDPHSRHWEYAQKEKQRLTEELDRNSSTLAQEGFSSDITDNMMKFNRDYQQSVSPTGMLGQIQGEHANIKAQEDLMRQNFSPTYGGDIVEKHLAREMEKYKEESSFDDKGIITSYKPRQLSKHQDYLKEADHYFTRAGITSDDWVKINSGLAKTEDGRFEYVATTTEEENWANNNSQLRDALNFMNNRIIESTGDLHQTILDQGRRPEDVIEDINRMMGIYKKQSTGKKEGNQMTNLMGGQDNTRTEPVIGVTVSAAGTYKITDTFEKIAQNVDKILNDPHALPVDKAKARDSQKLMETINSELINPESLYHDPKYAKNLNLRETLLSSIEFSKVKDIYLELENWGVVSEGGSFQRSQDQSDVSEGHVKINYNTKPTEESSFYGFNKQTAILSIDELNELREKGSKIHNQLGRANKELSKRRNERVNQHAHEELRYVVKHEKTSEGNLEAINLSRIGTINNLIAQHANITKNNIPQTLELKPDDKLQLASLIIGASPSEIISTLPTQVGRDVGINVVMRLKDSDVKVGGNKIGNELISVFIPINSSVEQITGHTNSAMLTISMLPEEYQESFKKMIDTKHISSTRNPEDLGQNAIPGRSVLGNTFDGDGEIDFLETKSDIPGENYTTMYGRIGKYDKFEPMTWENIIRYDVLEEESENSENYAKAFRASRIEETLKNSAKKYKIPGTNQTLYNKYNLGSKDNADWSGLLNELRRREIRLSHTQDVYEITRLKAFERYE